MNRLNSAQANAYGRYLSSTVMKGAPSLNLRQQESTRPANTLTSHARHAIPTAWSNNDPTNRDIALFDPRVDSSIMMYEQNGDMSLFQKIRNSNKSKIVTLGDDLLPNTAPVVDLNPNSLNRIAKANSNPYFPYLPESANNTRPKDLKPTLIDERMLHHTSDREFAWEDDKTQRALNLLKSPRRWQRQEAVDDQTRRLLHMGEPVDRWNENKNAYVNRPSVPVEYVIDDLKKRIEDAQKYNQLDDEATLQHINRTAMNPIYGYREAGMGIKDLNRMQSGNSDIVQTRYMNDYDYSYHEPTDLIKKESFLQTITNTVLNLFRRESGTGEATSSTYAPKQVAERFDPEPRLETAVERGELLRRLRVENSFLIRDGSAEVIAPDTPNVYGSSYVSPYSRMMCLESDGQLHIIQKLDSNRILGSDARPVGDDLVVTVLPREYTDKIRNKLHKSEGRKFKELTSHDYIALLDIITRDPQLMQRVKPSAIKNLLLDSEIDKRMLDMFSGKNTIVSDEALTKLFKATEIERAHTDLYNDKYKQKDVYEDKASVNANDVREIAEPRNLTFNRGERIQSHIDTSALDDEQARYYHDGNKKNDVRETFVQTGARFIGSASRFRGE